MAIWLHVTYNITHTHTNTFLAKITARRDEQLPASQPTAQPERLLLAEPGQPVYLPLLDEGSSIPPVYISDSHAHCR